ncbi:MAG: hypothetical protein H6970_08755 [Gammaproteobacteria bacterium]|nr:hypothetical protein [Gammaproteobacteria bacterium]MCP5425143.1 hypothetical protein [Gammaproteobacteria bacterium]MCP5459828.1 hypothetical protein [Gammaproteobacteria bacterium]
MELFTGATGPSEGQGEQTHELGQTLGMGEMGIFKIEATGFQATEQGFNLPTTNLKQCQQKLGEKTDSRSMPKANGRLVPP